MLVATVTCGSAIPGFLIWSFEHTRRHLLELSNQLAKLVEDVQEFIIRFHQANIRIDETNRDIDDLQRDHNDMRRQLIEIEARF